MRTLQPDHSRPQTKVTIVGKTMFTIRKILSGHFSVHKVLCPPPPLSLSTALPTSPGGGIGGGGGEGSRAHPPIVEAHRFARGPQGPGGRYQAIVWGDGEALRTGQWTVLALGHWTFTTTHGTSAGGQRGLQFPCQTLVACLAAATSAGVVTRSSVQRGFRRIWGGQVLSHRVRLLQGRPSCTRAPLIARPTRISCAPQRNDDDPRGAGRRVQLLVPRVLLGRACVPPGVPLPRAWQGCVRREGTSGAAPEAVRQAVGGGCQSGWGAVTVGYKCR